MGALLMGVTAVSNQIAIKPTAKWIDVRNKIEDAFRRNADLEARRITVNTHDGKVTLTGSVSSWSERDHVIPITTKTDASRTSASSRLPSVR